MQLQIFDSNGKQLSVGDLVMLQERRNGGLTFYTSVQLIDGQLSPFNKFCFDRAFFIDKIPADCRHTPATKDMPEYWMKNDLEAHLASEGRLEKWRMDVVTFQMNEFFKVLP